MLRSKLYTGFVFLAMMIGAPAALGQEGGVPFIADMPDDEAAEEIVETVKLGGEDNAPTMQEGVEQAESYEKTADPDSPVHVETGTDAAAQDETGLDSLKPTTAVTDPTVHDPSRVAYATNRKNARTMSLTVPGPRGIISDRNGLVMACSEVAYQPAVNFGQLQDESEENILGIARRVIDAYEKAGLKVYEKSDAQLLDHYKHRRWLSLPVGPTVRARELEGIRTRISGIEHGHLIPLYIRNYPHQTSACHILGYTGVKAKLPTGPINHNDPIFERQEGRAGLEKQFNKQLTGRPGIWRLMFDESGNKILDELQSKPKPGGTIVTTLNLEWQKAAEQSLRDNTLGRGAFVMIDVLSGEVVVLASTPNFDPNAFIPAISQKDYDALRLDPNTPLVSRAFAGVYPPASTFKTITVAAGLRHDVITEGTYVNCPYSVRIGGHEFKNHNKFSGSINCVTALVLSNNPFMYQIAATREPRIGAARLCDVARRFGYGSTTGLPLPDKAGNVPTEAWMHRNYGRGFMAGDAANMAIGQGALLATPLQVAHGVAGIANGSYLPKLQLIRQVLDKDGNVVYQFTPTAQNNLQDMSSALAVVRKGMKAVVNGGTGRRAALSYVSNAGKTGTAQWGPPSLDCRLAWFAGFLPADNPRYAYAALYEGKPHQRISGGHMAAMVVKSFFESIKPSMEEELNGPSRRAAVPEGMAVPEAEDTAEEVVPETAAPAPVTPDPEAVRQREEAERRQSQSGWDDGRSRN
ncbi:MAG: penicillin-binding transpeptidase domain-containing protein [Akkermansia sp.]|nr:penicillin-binding transpeptidase domain-containing protein [Akkermansia sp.]